VLRFQRIDAHKILAQLKSHISRGEKIPKELLKSVKEVLKTSVFQELKNRGLLHEEYLDHPASPEDDNFTGVEDEEEMEHAPSVATPEELDTNAKILRDDFFALEEKKVHASKCTFCFCRGMMPELHPMNVHILLPFLSPGGRIFPRTQTGLCAKWQRKVSSTIRRAKHLGILTYKKSSYYIHFPFEPASEKDALNRFYGYSIELERTEDDSISPVVPTPSQPNDNTNTKRSSAELDKPPTNTYRIVLNKVKHQQSLKK